MESARSADLSSVDRLRVVRIVWDSDDYPALDSDGNIVVVVIPGLIPQEKEEWRKAFLLFLRETEEVSGW